jgi:putative membrane protein
VAIHEKVGDDFWHAARDAAAARFAEGRFSEGIVAAIDRVGEVLAEHFPRRSGETDVDELSNELSEGGKP